MLYCVTDIGSNTVKMNIFDRSPDGSCRLVYAVSSTLGLAAKRIDGALTDRGTEQLAALLLKYKKDALAHGCDELHAFATASLRNVTNTEQVRARILHKTDIYIDVLSGEEEAQLSFLGMKRDIAGECGITVDLGGGSCELIRFENREPVKSVSIPLGCVLLRDRFIRSGKFPNEQESAEIYRCVRSEADRCGIGTTHDGYLVGGSARALFRLASAETGAGSAKNYEKADFIEIGSERFPYRTGVNISCDGILSREDFLGICEKYSLAYRDTETAHEVELTVPDRQTTAVPGMIALRAIADSCSLSVLRHCTSGVREGYLERLIETERMLYRQRPEFARHAETEN